jgi:integrase/recombinase XerD
MVRVRGKLYSHRFKEPETTVTTAKEWQEDQRVKVRNGPAKPTTTDAPEGFAADATRYLQAVAAMTSYVDRKRHIDLWIDVFGTTPRQDITTAQIAAQLAAWKKSGLAASSVNHRRTALLHLWRLLDGRTAANPVAGAPTYREPAPEARGLSYDIIRAIFAAMPDSLAKARLEVIAYTGLPPSSIRRLTVDDVDLKHGRMLRPERLKGAGTKRQTVPLTADAVRALRRLVAAKALGVPFLNNPLRRAFRRACAKVQEATGTTLARVRPYDLRHSYGTELYRLTGDERAVQMMLGHAQISTTHRYTVGAVDARLDAAVQAFDRPKSPGKVSPHKKSKKTR